MEWQPTTRLHVSGYRFLLRRIECALLGRDIREVNEPIRGPMQSLMAGSVLAIVTLAGCALLAVVRPQPAADNAPIVMGKQSGALYVRVGETLHPVLNLASARLIVRTNADPQPIPESELGHGSRGPLLGIPGAPHFVGTPLTEDELRWTVCDTRASASPRTTVVIGRAEGSRSRPLANQQSLLVRPISGGSTYLLYDGRRAVVNLGEPAAVRALGLDGQDPLPVSATLLNAVPEAPPLTAPRIPDAGGRGPAALPGFPVGSVLRLSRVNGDEYYVVLGHGIQRIGQVVADLLRFADSRGTRTAISVAPDVIRTIPTVTDLAVATFPDRAPSPLNAGATTLCVSWMHAASGGVAISISAGGLPIPAGQEPVKLSQADGKGPAIDAAYLSPGRSAYVRATGLSGDNPGAGTRYLITDTGVRFAIHDDDAAHDLGLPDTAIAAPWPVLAKLPAGPELSRANALAAS
ncbi:MAG TPA: type VII secretion protein EccB [Mycobacterium sp.]|nr:type VII secretion protein EccB [Mycobacterium sp.]